MDQFHCSRRDGANPIQDNITHHSFPMLLLTELIILCLEGLLKLQYVP